MERVYAKSRYDKGDAAYLNCPLTEAEYRSFVGAVLAAEKVEPRSFESVRYFEGCLPIEVMAARGEMTLAFGPMKPVGLEDPRTGERPFAVVQLRKEDEAGFSYNMVGFQTRMTWPEQKRVFAMIPGLQHAEYHRMGSVHRNTFVDAPACLDASMQLKKRSNLYLAGQITGVEGYVESCAGGLLCALMLAGAPPPPKTTALGGLLTHLGRASDDYQPSNITWAHIAPLPGRYSGAPGGPPKPRPVKKRQLWRTSVFLLRLMIYWGARPFCARQAVVCRKLWPPIFRPHYDDGGFSCGFSRLDASLAAAHRQKWRFIGAFHSESAGKPRHYVTEA